MKLRSAFFILLLLFTIDWVNAQSAHELTTTTTPHHERCLESFNQHSFKFNDTLDRHVLIPVAKGYTHIVHEHIRTGVTNFFNNINQISVFMNDFLQCNFYQGFSDSWRFIINSTVGIGGIFDVSSHIGLDYYYTDFGLTLSKWGWQNSHYLVIPFLGPSTIRDALGRTVDYFGFSPYAYLTPAILITGIRGLYYINLRADMLAYQNLVQQAAFDPYLFQKNAYLQHREEQIERTLHPENNWREHAANYLQSRKTSFLTLYYYQVPVIPIHS